MKKFIAGLILGALTVNGWYLKAIYNVYGKPREQRKYAPPRAA